MHQHKDHPSLFQNRFIDQNLQDRILKNSRKEIAKHEVLFLYLIHELVYQQKLIRILMVHKYNMYYMQVKNWQMLTKKA